MFHTYYDTHQEGSRVVDWRPEVLCTIAVIEAGSPFMATGQIKHLVNGGVTLCDISSPNESVIHLLVLVGREKRREPESKHIAAAVRADTLRVDAVTLVGNVGPIQ